MPTKSLLLGLRAEPEFGARNRLQGWTLVLTVAYTLKSLVKTPEAPSPRQTAQ